MSEGLLSGDRRHSSVLMNAPVEQMVGPPLVKRLEPADA